MTTKAAVFDQTPYVTDLQNEGYLTQDYDWENEYPYTWKDDNVRQFAEALQFIRDVYMDELEYTQYYGRNAIIWYRFAEGRYRKELEYKICVNVAGIFMSIVLSKVNILIMDF